YYRTRATRELNARFGDLQYRIQDLEATLVAEMVGRLLRQYGPRLQRAATAAAELDCLVSLAALAADGGPGGSPYCRPQLTTDNVLSIVNGRHPLAETVVDTYIPFTTTMHQDSGRLQVVTGPNASGKSCYARAVALIAFLAHLGSYVPAERATIGLADRIAARSAAAAAAAALPRAIALPPGDVSSMLRQATCRTLLILDEFGKVRNNDPRVSTAAAAADSLANASLPPRLILCTHFHELFRPGVLSAGGPYLAFYQMEQATAADMEAEQHVFLYRLVSGRCSSSFGVYCARLAGLDEAVCRRARV
ncbi:hypothetical protein VOLCADRAFT_43462, partial [Volvox carteri f. nagariensis]